ncbi:unnamed protein product [Hermetia illucens]|uniref:G domain-containing protein n=1 Tax=Hermetia illucens TaxID=343691 RepID=A0A7R8Z3D0_HERIL|nr:nitric oxide-associated protein 1 [Hermetia illucens]CAD7091817.1 unnamed protein product [Hermetia illucens]
MIRLRANLVLSRTINQIRLLSATSLNYSNSSNDISPEIQSKILFSSYLENQKLRLGYRKNRALEEAIRKYEKKEVTNRVNIKPFPKSLKAFATHPDDVEILATNRPESGKRGPETIQVEKNRTQQPENWLTDYEFYDSDDEGEGASKSGTADPSIPPSDVPCSGCGAVLHCADTGLPGYIPSEIFRGRTNTELKTIICQRCHFLKHYNIALDVAVPPEEYIKTLRQIQTKHALAILIVDLLDFPCSIWPGIQDILGSKRPVFVVGNKVDMLPRDSPGYLKRIKDCLIKAVTSAGIDSMNIKHVALISAKTGFGVEELITHLHSQWKYEGDVYLVGCTNVGKSTLFNTLLGSDYCKSQAIDLIQKATTCPWPGTTLKMLKFPIMRPSDIRLFYRHKRLISERSHLKAEEQLYQEQMHSSRKPAKASLIGQIGRTFVSNAETADPFSMSKGTSPLLTLNEKDKAFVNTKWCYDTPGVVHPDQILDLLTTEEIIQVTPNQVIQPQPFLMKPGMSVFLSGLGRLCFIEGQCDFIRVYVFTSSKLPILITAIEDADELYKVLRGSEYLPVPQTDAVRKRTWPGLEFSDPITITGEVDGGLTCDVVLSSAGWIAIELPIGKTCTFQAWTPHKRGIHVRYPALISHTNQLRGQRIRGSLAYKKKVCKL